MKWFMAINAAAPHFRAYLDMMRVALRSARAVAPGLEAHVLFDSGGMDVPVSGELASEGATVWPIQSRLYSQLRELARSTGRPEVMQYGPGVFLRMEIPTFCAARGWAESPVLYTDCDVMFARDPSRHWPELDTSFFAVAPDPDPLYPEGINSGVMLMNCRALLPMEDCFEQFVRNTLEHCTRTSWDQWAYQTFFRDGWQSLPAALNWRAYWACDDGASIVHFHGPKPFLRDELDAGAGTATQRQLDGPAFRNHCDRWDEWLSATPTSSFPADNFLGQDPRANGS